MRLWLTLSLALSGVPVHADDCHWHLGQLYARGIRQFWTSEGDFAATVWDPLVDRGFDHEAIAKLEDLILDNVRLYGPGGNAEELGRALHVSPQNAQMILSFYDLDGTAGVGTPAGFEAYNAAKRHVRTRLLVPLTLYLKQNQTRKDITAMTVDLRQVLRRPNLTENQVYEMMWLANLEMGKAWASEVSPDALARVRSRLSAGTGPLPVELGRLAVHLYLQEGWSKDAIAEALGVSAPSLTHHFHAIGVESNARAWTAREDATLKNWFKEISINELCEMLGRTEASVRARAANLGLTEPNPNGKPDLFLTAAGTVTDQSASGTTALKVSGVLQEAALGPFLERRFLAGRTAADVARELDVSLATITRWSEKLGVFPVAHSPNAPAAFNLKGFLDSKPQPGAAIFQAFVNGALQLPSATNQKGDPGKKLNAALHARKPAQKLIDEIPEAVRAQYPSEVEAFRSAYQQRLDTLQNDRSKSQGHVIFEAFVLGGLVLPPNKGVKGDPGIRLGRALHYRKSAEALIDEIPEAVRKASPEAVEAFRRAYQERLDALATATPEKTPGHAIFDAFVAGGGALPAYRKEKGDPGSKLSSLLTRRRPAQVVIDQIPEAIRLARPNDIEAFRVAYQARLDEVLRQDSKPPGQAIYEAFLAANRTMPEGNRKGEAGAKLQNALRVGKSADAIVQEIPEALRAQSPADVEAFRVAYQAELDRPRRDFSRKPGQVVFEAFLAGGSVLPPDRKTPGDPGGKLNQALVSRKTVEAIIAEIPEELRRAHPAEVEAFRRAYEERLRQRGGL